ncbi:MAG TPA: transcription termination factor NusA [Patescibacteria group bacterium]|nr:transcription termination factor NusA [Patescibacteria group bacterium]
MSEITKAIQALCDEKGLSYEAVLETIESALAAAFRKDFGNKQQNIKVKFDPDTANMQAWDVKTVVPDIEEEALLAAQEELAVRREKAREEDRELTEEETADLPRFNPKTEIMIGEAKKVEKKAALGDVLEIPLEIPGTFGRMAAQTAKQVIIQKIREAERGMVFEDFKQHERQIVVGTIQRVEGRKVLVDIGKVTAVLPSSEQIRRETYRPGSRMKFYVVSVEMTSRGPEIILSRSSKEMVKEVFRQEIPEVEDGVIEIKGVARDAGYRSKVSVYTKDENLDPIGSCIGQRGSRINTIIEELGGEKVDVIQYNDKAEQYIAHSLSPAKVLRVELNASLESADVYVAADQFSLAIGRSGQNVRLASELTGWRLNVKEEGGGQVVSSEELVEEVPAEEEAAE